MNALEVGASPFWVDRVSFAMSALLPIYPRKPTFIARFGMSQMCHQVRLSLVKA